jgi:hypothetical protein
VRFQLFEDTEDILARTDASKDGDPPPVPSKDDLKNRPINRLNVKGGKTLILSCYADDPREPDLIGEVRIDLTDALKKGEVDGTLHSPFCSAYLFNVLLPLTEWYTLLNKDKYSGEVYMEFTFWSNVGVSFFPVANRPVLDCW